MGIGPRVEPRLRPGCRRLDRGEHDAGTRDVGAVKSVPAIEFRGHRDPGYQGRTKASPGQPSASETLYVSPTGNQLPVKVLADGSTTVFSQWGSAVDVTTPNGAVVLKSSWLRPG